MRPPEHRTQRNRPNLLGIASVRFPGYFGRGRLAWQADEGPERQRDSRAPDWERLQDRGRRDVERVAPLNLGNAPRANLAIAGFCSSVREEMARLRGAGTAAPARDTEEGGRADFGRTARVKGVIASLCSGARGGMDTLCSAAAEATVGR